jgi:hypothetical protein
MRKGIMKLISDNKKGKMTSNGQKRVHAYGLVQSMTNAVTGGASEGNTNQHTPTAIPSRGAPGLEPGGRHRQ